MGNPRPKKKARADTSKKLSGEPSADFLGGRNRERLAENEARFAVIEEENKVRKEANERAAHSCIYK